MGIAWLDEQREQWQSLQDVYSTDLAIQTSYRAVDHQRTRIQQEMTFVLRTFIDGTLTVEEFNSIFQQKTHGPWNIFGLRGMSGGMFLNKLVKYINNKDALAHQLRIALLIPRDVKQARKKMEVFRAFLEVLITRAGVTKIQLQPSRIPFFLSAWWHLQNVEEWPIFFPIVHVVIMGQDFPSSPSRNTIENYFIFRERFLFLTKELGLSSWELEHLSTWYGLSSGEESFPEDSRWKRTRQRCAALLKRVGIQPRSPITFQSPSVLSLPKEHDMNIQLQDQANNLKDETLLHTHLQWLLAKIGQKVGCHVWIAKGDHQKVWKGEPLASLSLSSFPPLAPPNIERILKRIDVVWFQEDRVVAAYEIEHTTDISMGLLRLYDLGMLFVSQEIYLCVVVPKDRQRRVQLELARPSFEGHHLRRSCVVVHEETLLQHGEHILRWATSPSIIDLFSSMNQEHSL